MVSICGDIDEVTGKRRSGIEVFKFDEFAKDEKKGGEKELHILNDGPNKKTITAYLNKQRSKACDYLFLKFNKSNKLAILLIEEKQLAGFFINHESLDELKDEITQKDIIRAIDNNFKGSNSNISMATINKLLAKLRDADITVKECLSDALKGISLNGDLNDTLDNICTDIHISLIENDIIESNLNKMHSSWSIVNDLRADTKFNSAFPLPINSFFIILNMPFVAEKKVYARVSAMRRISARLRKYNNQQNYLKSIDKGFHEKLSQSKNNSGSISFDGVYNGCSEIKKYIENFHP